MSILYKHLALNASEALILKQIIAVQYDIAGDTTTDEIVTSCDTAVDQHQLRIIRDLTQQRINVLVMLTHTLATLEATSTDVILHFTENDYNRLHNEVDLYLGMITDMVEENYCDTTLSQQIQHIVDVNLMIQKIKLIDELPQA